MYSQKSGGLVVALCAAMFFAVFAQTNVVHAVNGLGGQGVVDGTNGMNADAYAFGRFLNGGSLLGNWTLDSSVSGTDFMNDAITGGLLGLEYVMMNDTHASSDVNQVEFDVNPAAGYAVDQISITQSPYSNNQGTWNGGNLESAQFQLNWTGGGTAVLVDPGNQFLGSGGSMAISPGTTLQFSQNWIENHLDAWQIVLPGGVADAQLDWSSANPVAGSDLTREWVTFDATFSTVPEPSSVGLLSVAALSLLGLRRRKR